MLLAGAASFLQLLASTASIFGIPMIGWLLFMIVVGIWPVIGGLIITRHPHHPVGWLLFASFPLAAIDLFVISYTSFATSSATVSLPIPGIMLIWLKWSAQSFVNVSFTLLNLLFPTGKLLTPRWRMVAWASMVTLPFHLGFLMVAPGLSPIPPGMEDPFDVGLDYPYSVSENVWAGLKLFYFLTIIILLLCSLVSVISLFLRLRRARRLERQQVKWLIFPAFVFWLSQLFVSVSIYDPYGIIFLISMSLLLLSVPLIVIAVAFAIFRYRLYDIDLIIRRTLVYSILTTTLVVFYLGLVILLEAALRLLIGSSGQVATVISTLTIIVLFTPLRRRVQDTIDRRFYRRKYDAEQALAQFAATAREETDLEALSDQVVAIVQNTMQPEQVSLWLRGDGKAGKGALTR